MSGSSYSYDKSSSFFSCGDDVDDETFLKGGKAYQGSSVDDRRKQLLDERKRIEDRTLQSSFRSIGLLQETEKIGNDTAQELVQQREQLKNTEQKLDDINRSLRTSQRHIQGIKSIFGSIRNYLSGPKGEQANTSQNTERNETVIPKSKSQLSGILESAGESEQEGYGGRVKVSDNIPRSSSTDVDGQLSRNLDEMGSVLTRLKGLGLNLHDEIQDQNAMLDRITIKTEDVHFRTENQNKEMNRILKK